MAASPKNGVITFKGTSGATYTYSVYWSDVANAFVTWATTASAGSGSVNFITAPEDMLCTDFVISAAPTDTTATLLWLDDAPVRNMLIADANIVNTIQNRSFGRIGIKAGRKVQFVQLA